MLNKYRPIGKKTLAPLTNYLVKKNTDPNHLSLISLIAAISSTYFYINNNLAAATILVLSNALLDALDGEVARKQGKQGKRGDFIDHIIDRYSDVFILAGITFSPHTAQWIGVLVIVGVLLTSYLGTQAQAVGIGRIYAGVMGRADRLVLIITSSFLTAVIPKTLSSFTILGWTFVLIGVLSYITFIQRFLYVWKKL